MNALPYLAGDLYELDGALWCLVGPAEDHAAPVEPLDAEFVRVVRGVVFADGPTRHFPPVDLARGRCLRSCDERTLDLWDAWRGRPDAIIDQAYDSARVARESAERAGGEGR